MHSYAPAIEAMVAVGAIAMSNELRNPCVATRSRNVAHRCGSVGVTPHRSNCNLPAAARVSAKAACAPLASASSVEVHSAWK